jgi:hypothetical protein
VLVGFIYHTILYSKLTLLKQTEVNIKVRTIFCFNVFCLNCYESEWGY